MTLIFERDRARDEDREGRTMTGYRLLWPDGSPVDLALANFCKIGVRYLFGRQIPERAGLGLLLYLLPSREAPLPRQQPHRVRILCLHRAGTELRLHLADDSATDVVFDLDRDDSRVLEWLGASGIPDGGQQWLAFQAIPQEG